MATRVKIKTAMRRKIIMFTCPICNNELKSRDNSLVCKNNHCFDFAKQGYINLLPVQQKKSLNPGDSKDMLMARRSFLSKGHYSPIKDEVARLLSTYRSGDDTYLDIGCGEGYYTTEIAKLVPFANVVGTDIAKDAVRMCCSRSKEHFWAVATASHLPLRDNSVDCITAIFSLVVGEEYHKKLKKGGIIVEVSAGNNHLIELKREIYSEVFKQDKKQKDLSPYFKTECQGKVTFPLSLEGEDLKNLLDMTPHINRIKEDKKQQLYSLSRLDLTVDCQVRVLKKC